jgi:hypothetical protein
VFFQYNSVQMIFGRVRQQIQEHFEEIKKMAMVGAIALIAAIVCVGFIPLFALVHTPQHAVIQENLDRYHSWINYGDTVPKMGKFVGIKSARPTDKGDGWISKLSSPKLIFNPNFILDYNNCLTRALYTTHWNPGFHTRMSLCPHPPYNKRIGHTMGPSEQVTIDIRKFGSNERGDVKSTDRGIALSWNEYVSLVKNFKWVESFFLHHGTYSFPDEENDPNKLYIGGGMPILGMDVDDGIDNLYINKTISDNSTYAERHGQATPVGSLVY